MKVFYAEPGWLLVRILMPAMNTVKALTNMQVVVIFAWNMLQIGNNLCTTLLSLRELENENLVFVCVVKHYHEHI